MKFTEAPLVKLGPRPKDAEVLMRGSMAGMMMSLRALRDESSKTEDSVLVFERVFPRVRVRMWHPSLGGNLWSSAGYTTMSLLTSFRLLRCAMISSSIPRAWVRK